MNPDGAIQFDDGWLTAAGVLDVSAVAPGFGEVAIWATIVMSTEIKPVMRLSTQAEDGTSSSALSATGTLERVPRSIGPDGREFSLKGTIEIAGSCRRQLWARYRQRTATILDLWIGGEAA